MFPRLRTPAIAILFSVGILAGAGSARAAGDPAKFVADLGTRAVDVLTSHVSDADREKRFRALFDEGFDLNAISRFVLGPYWKTATPAQQQEFAKLFEAYEVHSYSVRFSQYSGQQLKVLGSRPEGDSAAIVQSQIAQNGDAPPVKVDWRVSSGGAGEKITDVVVEGVSMALTERQQFASIIQRGGGQIEPLLKLLREKAGS
jgi:phospholipid transport system substrate-binding protein